MKVKASALLIPLMLGCLPAAAQRDRRPASSEASDVEVTRSATLRITIAGDPINIFDSLVDARKLEGWFPDQAVSEAQLGGRYHFRWNDKPGVWSGRYTSFIRGNTLSYTWEAPGDEYETSVLVRLVPEAQGTLVELTQSGFASNVALDRAIKSWTFYLDNLRSVIEEGVDLRRAARRTPARRRPRATRREE